MIKLPIFQKKKCSYLYKTFVSAIVLQILFPSLNEGKNCNIFLGLQLPLNPRTPTVFGTNQTCLSTPCFAHIFPTIQYFPNHWLMHIFLTSGINLDIVMNMLEDCIIFLIWAAWVLIFISSKNKFFSLELYWKCLLHLFPLV